eukprot:g6538.t1
MEDRLDSHFGISDDAMRRKLRRARFRRALNLKSTEVLLMACTIWALFAPDCKIAFDAHVDEDDTIGAVTLVAMIIFVIEIGARLWLQNEPGNQYCRSVYFYLDVLATISMLADMPWTAHVFGDDTDGSAARASRAARAAARAARLLRLVRIISCVRRANERKVRPAHTSYITPLAKRRSIAERQGAPTRTPQQQARSFASRIEGPPPDAKSRTSRLRMPPGGGGATFQSLKNAGRKSLRVLKKFARATPRPAASDAALREASIYMGRKTSGFSGAAVRTAPATAAPAAAGAADAKPHGDTGAWARADETGEAGNGPVSTQAGSTTFALQMATLMTARATVGLLFMLFMLPLFEFEATAPGDQELAVLRQVQAAYARAVSDGGAAANATAAGAHAAAAAAAAAAEASAGALHGLLALLLHSSPRLLLLRIAPEPGPAALPAGAEWSGRLAVATRVAAAPQPLPALFLSFQAGGPAPGAVTGLSEGSGTFALYDRVSEARHAAWMNIAVIVVVSMMIAGGSALFERSANELARMIVAPLRKVARGMDRSALFDLDDDGDSPSDTPCSTPRGRERRGPAPTVGEIRQMQHAFGRMQAGLKAFSRYVPVQMVRVLTASGEVARLKVERKPLAVLFCDIAGFEETVVERLSARSLMRQLAEFLDMMTGEVEGGAGLLAEFIGDEILALWGCPEDVPGGQRALAAVDVAVNMQGRVCKMNAQWRLKAEARRAKARQRLGGVQLTEEQTQRMAEAEQQELAARGEERAELRLHIGVNVGQVWCGNLGSNERMKYGVLGDAVNLSARTKSLNNRYRSQLLVTEDTVLADGVGERFVVRPVDFVIVKGKSKPVRLLEVMARRVRRSTSPAPGGAGSSVVPPAEYESLYPLLAPDTVEKVARMHSLAFDAYLARDFREAARLFKSVMDIMKIGGETDGGADAYPDDGPATILRKRAMTFMMSPPPADWDGVDVLKGKKG